MALLPLTLIWRLHSQLNPKLNSIMIAGGCCHQVVTRDAARSRKRRPGRKLAAVQTERKAGSWWGGEDDVAAPDEALGEGEPLV